ncbi:MAG: aminodeoxychorismate/anthranilate synthase component II [bacterium]|nr:aminodeoxychorismate/anthranilate synthase component II [bacterium]
MILLIDNYDSFTYNLVQYLGEIGKKEVDVALDLRVYRNDKIETRHISRLKPQAIIISPGPGSPLDAGISNEVISHFAGNVPILGVCLGHQCIGHVFGAKIVQAKRPMHGKTSLIYHDGKVIYKGIENPFIATRYHSLIIKRDTLPDCLEITAWTEEEEIMGVRHKEYMVEGVQFHPESILTKVGKEILRNFLLSAIHKRGEL